MTNEEFPRPARVSRAVKALAAGAPRFHPHGMCCPTSAGITSERMGRCGEWGPRDLDGLSMQGVSLAAMGQAT
jgi:hypothetical protein